MKQITQVPWWLKLEPRDVRFQVLPNVVFFLLKANAKVHSGRILSETAPPTRPPQPTPGVPQPPHVGPLPLLFILSLSLSSSSPNPPPSNLSWGRPSVPVSVRVNSNVPCSMQGCVLLLQERLGGGGEGNGKRANGRRTYQIIIALITSCDCKCPFKCAQPKFYRERFSRPLNKPKPINSQQLDALAGTAKAETSRKLAQRVPSARGRARD